MVSPLPSADLVFEAALGALPVPAYANDLDGYVTWQNAAARAVGGDLVGVHYSKAVPPEELTRARETWSSVTLSGATKRRTGFFKGATGDLVELEVITAPIHLHGHIVGVFGIAIPCNGLPRRQATMELSPRQLDVLRLLVRGRSTREIAVELTLAPETVRNHVRRLLKTLEARTRLEACLIAIRNGLVRLDLD
jgi:DNA-binding CsgD family transcriptional regulator